MIQDENISFERESDSYSPNFNVLHTNNFDPKFFSNPKPSPHQLYTSSISSLVEDSSSSFKILK